MNSRFVAIWFPRLLTDWQQRRDPSLNEKPFAFAADERGRRVVKAVNALAIESGAFSGMTVADCRALVPGLEVIDYDEDRPRKLLFAMAGWAIRFTPFVAVDPADGLILDASGCTHLWGGEERYLEDIAKKFAAFGYNVRVAMADTIGAAWGVSRFGENGCVVKSGKEREVLSLLPPAALRLEGEMLARLDKLGLDSIGRFIVMPRIALRRRFGQTLLTRIAQALGEEMEIPEPVKPVVPFQERLPCLEPIRTAPGIAIALNTLLETLCARLMRECKGIRQCDLKCYRIDGKIQKITIGTSKPSRNPAHLFKLFENRIAFIEPDLGIELFVLEAPVVEELSGTQDAMWNVGSDNDAAVAELLDRLAGRTGGEAISRYLPAEHYWPERSIRVADSLTETPKIGWRKDLQRPLQLLKKPEEIEVSVPIPDYPPMLFRHKGTLHTIIKADGPERIEQEWWLQPGLFRDYYCVEDEGGNRYWLFRAGDYEKHDPKWFIHGYFA
jgi:protein ImuB